MPDQASTTPQCPFCKEEVKVDATRCMHCQARNPTPGETNRPRHLPVLQGGHPTRCHPCKNCKTDLVQGETQTFFREQRLAGLPAPFQRTASGRHMALRQTGKRSAENEPRSIRRVSRGRPFGWVYVLSRLRFYIRSTRMKRRVSIRSVCGHSQWRFSRYPHVGLEQRANGRWY